MKLLLDTHVFLWWLADDPRLGKTCRQMIANGQNDVVLSSASIWEIVIKSASGKLRIDGDLSELVESEGFQDLPIKRAHAQALAALSEHHRDPFDRILVAQAQVENLTLCTVDEKVRMYPVALLDARL